MLRQSLPNSPGRTINHFSISEARKACCQQPSPARIRIFRAPVTICPKVKPIFEEFITQRGVSDRVKFLAGNFFTDPLPAGDVLIMGRILHDWDLA